MEEEGLGKDWVERERARLGERNRCKDRWGETESGIWG